MKEGFVSVFSTLLVIVLAVPQSFGAASVSFAKAVITSSAASGANSVVSADVNQDGTLDLVVATNGGVTVALGNGDGTFQQGITYATAGEFSESVAVVDVNGDGLPDIIVTNMCTGTCSGVAVLLNNANNPGTFLSAVGYNTGGNETGAVVVGDVNNDGAPDLILTSNCQEYTCAGGVLTLLLGNGDGTFKTTPQDLADTKGPVAIGDVNNDGNLDLVTGAGVMLGNGNGTFQTLNPDIIGGTTFIVLADVNNDGKLDMIAAVGTGVTVQLGNGDGTFQAAQSFKSGGNFPLSVAVADLNGDNRPDIVVANECTTLTKNVCSGAGSVGVLPGNGNGTFQTAVAFTSGGDITTSAVIADANGDTKPDVWVASACTNTACTGDGVVGVLLNNYFGTTSMKVVSSVNPALIDQNVTFTATVSPAIADGTDIVFTDAGNYIGDNTTVNGVTSITYAFPNAGGQSIKATFAGDTYHNGSSAGFVEDINKVNSVTVVTSTLNPSTYGQSVSLNAAVSSALSTAPTGNVTFYNGTASLGTAALSGGIATLTKTTLPAGLLTITAVYVGDFETLKSTSAPITQTVNQASTTTTLISSVNPSKAGQSVRFTASVTSPTTTVTGSVTFMDGTTVLGTGNLAYGSASYSTTGLASGTHNITAVYNGTTNIATSTSAILVQTVN